MKKVPSEVRTKPLWRCPRCGARFVTRNLPHSCGQFTVQGFLKGKPKRGVQLYRHFVREYRKLGPLLLHPVKTRIAFMVKMRFASVSRIGKDSIGGGLILPRRCPDRRFRRIEFLPPHYYLHSFTLYRESEIDESFRRFMRLAYAMGQRKHLVAKVP